jgi:hypothetical protein
MKMRAQAQANQETIPNDSVRFSDDDIEVARSLRLTAHTNIPVTRK